MKLAELIIQLRADSAQLSRDFSQAHSEATQFASNVTSLLTGIGEGVALGGLSELISGIGEAGHKIKETADNSGMAAGEISALRNAALDTGEDFNSLASSLTRFGKNITEGLAVPSSAAGKVLSSLFSKAEEESLKLETPSARLHDVLERIN